MSLEHKTKSPNTFIGIDESYPYVLGRGDKASHGTIVVTGVVSHHRETAHQGRYYHKIRGRGDKNFSVQDVLDALRSGKAETFRYTTLPTDLFNKDVIPGLNKVQTLELLAISSMIPYLTRKPERTELFIDVFGNTRIIQEELTKLLYLQNCPIPKKNIHLSEGQDTKTPITNLADYMSWCFSKSFANGKYLLDEFPDQRIHSQEILRLKQYL